MLTQHILQVELVSEMMVPPNLHIDLPDCIKTNTAGMSPWKAQGVALQTTGYHTAGSDLYLGVCSLRIGRSQRNRLLRMHLTFVFVCSTEAEECRDKSTSCRRAVDTDYPVHGNSDSSLSAGDYAPKKDCIEQT